MRLTGYIYLTFGSIWFATKLIDYLAPPANPTFNAALALVGAMGVMAAGLQQRS